MLISGGVGKQSYTVWLQSLWLDCYSPRACIQILSRAGRSVKQWRWETWGSDTQGASDFKVADSFEGDGKCPADTVAFYLNMNR